MKISHAYELLEQFDAQERTMLLDAFETDIIEYSEILISVSQSDDESSMSRAHHSLKGLCANFGAQTLADFCDADLADPKTVQDFRKYRELIVKILHCVSESIGDCS